MGIGERLKDERERLELSQEELASIAGVHRKSQGNYEAGERAPDAEYLAAASKAGLDVLYVVTGHRGGTVLTAQESCLIDNYRHSPEPEQRAILTTSNALAQPKKRGRAVKKNAA